MAGTEGTEREVQVGWAWQGRGRSRGQLAGH